LEKTADFGLRFFLLRRVSVCLVLSMSALTVFHLSFFRRTANSNQAARAIGSRGKIFRRAMNALFKNAFLIVFARRAKGWCDE